ncbi:MAG: c-type cytochrome [bacterium]|nr:c-type cytochrome [bacterium]
MKKSAILISALLLMGLAPAYAEDGSRLFQRKGCYTCHGAAGANPITPQYPVLAGQNKDYIVSQIAAFSNKHRQGTLNTNQMVPFANSITKDGPEVVGAIAEYLASNQPTKTASYDNDQVHEGEEVFMQGGCAACHGEDAKTPIMPNYPKLAGLSPEYLANQLYAFGAAEKKATRGGTPEAMMMAPMAQGLTAEQVKAVSNYLASLK